MKRRRSPCVLCAIALGAMAALASAQEPSHDALAFARAKATSENQRVLLWLRDPNAASDEDLAKALAKPAVRKLVRYEYQRVALPVATLPATALAHRLELGDLQAPALVALDTDDVVLGTATDPEQVLEFLRAHVSAPVDARAVLARGLETAKHSERNAFVYLSAPW
ncbi:MAG: hypothetical protein AAF628_35430 [Planctomycetota bacterium]